MGDTLPARFVSALLALRSPHEAECASWSYRPETDFTPACNCLKATRDRAINDLLADLRRWSMRVSAFKLVLSTKLVGLGVVSPPRLLPTPWDAAPGRALLALVEPGNAGELLHAIDLLGGAVTSDALPRHLKAQGLMLQMHGLLRLGRFVDRPRALVNVHSTTCLLWEVTDLGRELLASLRTARAPRFGWEDVVVDWMAVQEASCR